MRKTKIAVASFIGLIILMVFLVPITNRWKNIKEKPYTYTEQEKHYVDPRVIDKPKKNYAYYYTSSKTYIRTAGMFPFLKDTLYSVERLPRDSNYYYLEPTDK